jgi:YD repeat-containing protein
VIGMWAAAMQGCVAMPSGEEGSPPNLFGRVGTGDTAATGATAATGDTGAPVAPRCRILREQGDFDYIDYTYVDYETYSVGIETRSTGGAPILQTYDPMGTLLSRWESSFGEDEGIFYVAGRAVLHRSFSGPGYFDQFVQRYEYDSDGGLLSRLQIFDQNVWSNVDDIFLDTWTYDSEGRQTGWGYDQLADGVNEAVGTFTYDSDGLLVEQHDDYEPSTASDWSTYTTRWEYDERGLPTRSEMTGVSWTGGPTCDFREYTYDDRGDLVIEENVSCVSGRVFLRWTDTYDDRHLRTESVWDLIDPVHPGPDDEHWWWTYDEYGNLTSEVREQSGLTTTTWTWECR